MKTQSVRPQDITKRWLIIDAKDQTLGRLASRVVHVLRGKHKTYFVPHLDCGDNVIVINADKIVLSGNKLSKKMYHWHSGYMGGIKSITAAKLKDKKPTSLLERAVRGMLPKNKLRAVCMKNLRIYAGSEHSHQTQSPVAVDVSGLGVTPVSQP
ncbi:MAG: 50S ribosomal protein L13 [Proteobacteria bacterium]|nr:50S ribosomal protein L13 [Pseudomonadota bacterium]